ncbi:MAG: succinate dehydrogenase assembly factor 2 [Burkholderiales bacterium]
MDPVDYSRLKWRARRGLLENDLALGAFFERHGAALDDSAAAALNHLLDLADGDLWDLISGRAALAPGAPPAVHAVLANLRQDDALQVPVN